MKATGARTIKKATGVVSTALTFSAELRFGKWLGVYGFQCLRLIYADKLTKKGKA